VAYEFKLPDLGEGLTEGEVARWLVAEGDQIAEDQPLVEIQTDKTTVEIPSPAAGTVTSILVAEGELAPVGTVLVVIGGDGGSAPSGAAAPAAAIVQGQSLGTAGAGLSGKVQATPLVRRVARELGVDLATVTPTGGGGRITEADVRGAAGAGASSSLLQAEGRRERLRGVRRQIAEHLTRAHHEIPAVTYVEECDFSNVEMKLLLPAVLRATALSLQEFPELNARLDREEIVYLDRYDLGVAMQTEQGLVVPVVRGCEARSIDELRAEVDELAGKARAGNLAPEELRGSTFTVTSAGRLAGLFVTPLVNHPEVAILGVHRVGPRPVVRDGEIVVRPMGNVSVTFDHRVVDGARAAAFALAVIARLEGSARRSPSRPVARCADCCPHLWWRPRSRSRSASPSASGTRRPEASPDRSAARSAARRSSPARCGAAARGAGPRPGSRSLRSSVPRSRAGWGVADAG
jgi:2-oxoisovalerate dehydrogenase E2 component (dihydrolipoyl transacylase)